MRSRLQLIVVLLFIGIAGLIFVFSDKNSDNTKGLEVVEDISDSTSGKITDKKLYSSGMENSSKLKDKAESEPSKDITIDSTTNKNINIFVHVCGAVKKEGVYELKSGSRVVDAIKAAGGLLEKAASYGINQAEALSDGMQIYVPTKKEVSKTVSGSSTPNSLLKSSEAGKSGSGLVNINTATKDELMKLNGVGEAKAALIITYRETNGGFKDITDLMKIKGIKQKFFDKIKDNICV